jgi:Uma2 family endonuclease
MASPQRKLATYADLLALPQDTQAEVLGGDVVLSPAPLPRHSKAQGSARRFIGGPFDDDDGHGGPGGWWVFVEVNVTLTPHDIVRPDLAGWRRDRLSHPDRIRPLDVVPDWVCEVLSPSTAARDRIVKWRLYAQAGIPFYWLIDPDLRALEALALRDGVWVELGVFDETATARIAPFEAIELEIGRLFLPKEPDET